MWSRIWLLHIIAIASLLCSQQAESHSLQEWKSRSIYQVLTDRFAEHEPQGECSLRKYCGGTFRGIAENLDYIERLGFDAIWISPVVANTPDGYHGYWASNIFEVNSEFGQASDLLNLVEAAHAKGIWVMVDVVANHMGPIQHDDVSGFTPFNKKRYYHNCTGCGEYCGIIDYDNPENMERCRLHGLPDLDQSRWFVRAKLLRWIKNLVTDYHFDGIRIDTVPFVKKEFWQEFTKAADTFSMGEVLDGRVERLADYWDGSMDSLLDYPTFFTLRDVFERQEDMTHIAYRRGQQEPYFSARDLGVFVDNHDNPRFLHDQSDQALYKNALAYVMLGEGIPIVYYGSEQAFSGGQDPDNREPLWSSKYQTNGDLFSFIALMNKIRKMNRIWSYDHVQLYVDKECYSFVRGTIIVALTNAGSGVGISYCAFKVPSGWAHLKLLYPTDKMNEVVPVVNGLAIGTFNLGEPVVLQKHSDP